ncbi:hypothetical protein HYG86_12050 [Alkalicella caledoniensis]|uniref:Uncharacterized protein n=1 Tax=Alkalicella caledoniensis TaxID=2731377 RepID=A0A7G9W9T2_ALKCA|nr:hypothetical protein [Alkalicella caledoniensis]QNO15444.1 hypothetical protein HYG86_12050 [Alkalicella caledoniensis]
MLNYIKSEFYRIFNRLDYWIFTGIIIVGVITVELILRIVFPDQSNILGPMFNILNLITSPIIIFGFSVEVITMVTSEENDYLTLKNIVSHGLSREKIVISKLIVSTIVVLKALLIFVLILLFSNMIVRGRAEFLSGEVLMIILVKSMAVLFLWVGVISMANFVAQVSKNTKIFALAFGITFWLMHSFFNDLFNASGGLNSATNLLITKHLSQLSSLTFRITPNPIEFSIIGFSHEHLIIPILVGLGYTVFFTVLSIAFFRRKEVR